MPTLKEILTDENIKTILKIAKESGYINVRLLCWDEDEEPEISGTLMLIADEDPDSKGHSILSIDATLAERFQCQVRVREMAHIHDTEIYDAEKHLTPLNDFEKIEKIFEKTLDKIKIKKHEENLHFYSAKIARDSFLKKINFDVNNTSIIDVNSPVRVKTPPQAQQPSPPKKPRIDLKEFAKSITNPKNINIVEGMLLELSDDEVDKMEEKFLQQEQQAKLNGGEVSPSRG